MTSTVSGLAIYLFSVSEPNFVTEEKVLDAACQYVIMLYMLDNVDRFVLMQFLDKMIHFVRI